MRDAGHALQRTASIAVPAGLADEGVAVEPLAGDGIGAEGADNRQELRGRAGVVLLIEAGQHDVSVGGWLPADRGREHHPVVGDVVDIGVGIARATDEADGKRVGGGEVDVAQHFLAVKAAIDEANFAARVEIGRLADEVDEAADRPLPEQHRGRATHDLDAREIIGVRRDRGIVAEDVTHPVAELQRIEPAHVEAVDAGVAAIRIGEHTRGIFHRVADADRALRFILLGGDDLDRLRQFGERSIGLGSGIAGDDDRVLAGARIGFGSCVSERGIVRPLARPSRIGGKSQRGCSAERGHSDGHGISLFATQSQLGAAARANRSQ